MMIIALESLLWKKNLNSHFFQGKWAWCCERTQRELNQVAIMLSPMFPREIRELILAFFFISVGGLFLHIRIHPPSQSMFFWIPAAFGFISTLVVPVLFMRQATAAYAYLFTWAAVIAGTAFMAYFSITSWNMAISFKTVILKSTFADIMILWAKIFLAHKILRFYWPNGVNRRWERGCIQ